jgi:hypothetical protein
MVRFPAVAAAACAACVLGVSALGVAAYGQPSPPAQPLTPIETSAASPPASSGAEVAKQPLYKTSWEHYQALKAKAHPPQPQDWTGVWANMVGSAYAWEPGFPFNKYPIPNAPLNAEYRKRIDKLYANAVAGADYDTLSDCIPPGWPRLLVESTFEFGIQPKQTLMFASLGNELRTIRTDGTPHVPDEDAIPGWEGDSIGFWDGDTLIIHTNHVRGLPMSYQRNGPPTSDQVSGVEQWRMVDPQHIRVQITIYDPEVLTGPWRPAPRTYERIMPPNTPLLDHYMCVRGDVVRNAKGATELLLPGDPRYLDADLLVEKAKGYVDANSR